MLPAIKKRMVCSLLSISVYTAGSAQVNKQSLILWDGMAIAGYVNDGAFINFGGPCIRLVKKPLSVGFGILPTLRIKKDKVAKGAIHNSILMPTAGFGFTMVYKHFVAQLPFYYNPKTSTAHGQWNAGFGIGYKIF